MVRQSWLGAEAYYGNRSSYLNLVRTWLFRQFGSGVPLGTSRDLRLSAPAWQGHCYRPPTYTASPLGNEILVLFIHETEVRRRKSHISRGENGAQIQMHLRYLWIQGPRVLPVITYQPTNLLTSSPPNLQPRAPPPNNLPPNSLPIGALSTQRIPTLEF